MLQKYSRGASLSEAFLLTYIAKKRAEVAPGVGTATDMFMINRTDEKGWYSDGLRRDLIEGTLEQIFRNLNANEDRAMAEAHNAILDRVFPKPSVEATPPTQPSNPAAPQSPPETTHDQ
jgi:hypothetical protein